MNLTNTTITWKHISVKRKFLDELAKKYNIKEPKEWGKITPNDFEINGGKSLLKQYDGSIYKCLKYIYIEIPWKKDWFPSLPKFHNNVIPSFWTSIENRRIFLEEIGKKLNIKQPSDWGKIKIDKIKQLGGNSLLHHYNGSLYRCLQALHPEITWKKEWFPKVPNFPMSYWNLMENRRKFLDSIKITLNIKEPKDWGRVNIRDIQKLGGGSLERIYNGSIFACLQSVFPEIEWNKEWFPNMINIESSDRTRNFFEDMKRKFNIKEPKDWGKVTVSQIKNQKGGRILKRYNNSLFRCLKSIYTEIEWKREWFPTLTLFPKNYWSSKQNSLNLLNKLKIRFRIEEPRDWGKVTTRDFKSAGGANLLCHYKGSLLRCLKSVYSDIEWKKEWFPKVPIFAKEHWNSIENCKSFLDELAFASNVRRIDDWRKVSTALIKSQGGRGLLLKYGGSIEFALKAIFPVYDWNDLLIEKKRSSSQLHLEQFLKGAFGVEAVLTNYRNHLQK